MVKPRVILMVSGVLVLIGIGITAYESQTMDNLPGKEKNYPESAAILDILVSTVLAVGLGGLALGMIYFIKSRAKTG